MTRTNWKNLYHLATQDKHALTADYNALSIAHRDLEIQAKILTEAKANLALKVESLRAQNEELTRDNHALTGANRALADQYQALTKEIEDLNRARESLINSNDLYIATNTNFQIKVAEQRTRLEAAGKEIDRLQAENRRLTKEIEKDTTAFEFQHEEIARINACLADKAYTTIELTDKLNDEIAAHQATKARAYEIIARLLN